MKAEAPTDWIRPNWPAPPSVHALFTTRAGGVSAAPYHALNLGDHVGDAPERVRANRERLQACLPAQAIYLQQVHGRRVLVLQPGTGQGQCADASITQQPGLACTVLVADCLPVLLASTDGRCVAAAHAGWRGLAAGVLSDTMQALQRLRAREHAAQPGAWMAWLGPCIGPAAFEVGADVVQAFVRLSPDSARAFRPCAAHKWLADLPALARMQLAAAGVHAVYGNDGGAEWCTVQQASRFFSHRRDGVSGRMAACIWRA